MDRLVGSYLMTPVDQTQFAGEGVGGNCVQASVASILDLPLSAVPHFLEAAPTPSEWELAFWDWCEERGIGLIRRSGEWIFDGYYLASGPSPRGVNHMVVYRDGVLAHDPHPSRAGVLEVRQTWVLAPLDPAAIRLRTAVSA
ncbi:hypothetical protein [Ciceribacter sp. L1K22]|uniref:hypothetical protein n=1 Tax=Ciceribacter sp. L1K22 TaxID=2820275 RepID=UPI001ABE6C1F|nr:hypothetical protein [Ciceribacter sp. L1K22]MBO3760337.1 hypothetical protein [Ciceribacter sp. L1K22]